MIVMKFGGTSVGSSDSIEKVIEIILNENRNKIVVLSAFSGVTNLLATINQQYESNDSTIQETIIKLEERCLAVIDPLLKTTEYLELAKQFVSIKIDQIKDVIKEPFSLENTKIIIGQGELISSNIIQLYLEEKGINSKLIEALDFMKKDENGEPDSAYISSKINPILKQETKNIYITQGFICKDYDSSFSNLERGGSDYTASLIGAAIKASEIQIWTDIDGMHNNDPRYVENTFSLEEISFDEAAELAYFGAKILHPQSLIPAKNNNIPVLLKNTFDPYKKGTLIKNNTKTSGVSSIAAKDKITAIKIKSYRMLLAYGFLKRVFEVFEVYKTPIDMITTSEVAVSLTIDNNQFIKEIVEDLQKFGAVEVETNLSIICVAGDFSEKKEGLSARVFNALKHIPIRMISYGGSNYNISLLVKTADKINALNSLNTALFKKQLSEIDVD